VDDPFGRIQGIGDSLPLRRKELEFLTFADQVAPSGTGFSGVLQGALRDVATAEGEARDKIEGLVSGRTQEIHEVMAAMNKSEVAFTMLLEVRNKLVDAWREITHMSL
jgi:flagellar hook-basal body complex protein FliE